MGRDGLRWVAMGGGATLAASEEWEGRADLTSIHIT